MKFWLVWIFLLASSYAKTQCNFVTIGDSLLQQNKFTEANVLVENVFYENKVEQLECAILFKIKLLKFEKQHSNLLDFINNCYNYNLTDSFKNIIIYEEAFAYFLNENYLQTKHLLNFYKPTYKQNKCLVDAINIICSNNLNEWNAADSLYNIFCVEYGIIDSSYKKLSHQKPHLLNAKKAQILSSILPGAGQVYAGNLGEGIASFLLQGLSIYAGVVWWQKDYKLATILMASNFESSFYSGGKQRAKKLVENKNHLAIDLFNKTLNNQVLKDLSKALKK
ncbi:MAG: hypothetical protein NTZ59_03335 [Bacteroidetes bacterium]|nr:hypothetical protein [Bacteroidota bacterium]